MVGGTFRKAMFFGGVIPKLGTFSSRVRDLASKKNLQRYLFQSGTEVGLPQHPRSSRSPRVLSPAGRGISRGVYQCKIGAHGILIRVLPVVDFSLRWQPGIILNEPGPRYNSAYRRRFVQAKRSRGAARQETMSQINGDKSRFHRERKQNIQRRIRTRELLEAAGKKTATAVGVKKIKAAPVK